MGPEKGSSLWRSGDCVLDLEAAGVGSHGAKGELKGWEIPSVDLFPSCLKVVSSNRENGTLKLAGASLLL